MMVAAVFAMQGLGILVGSIVVLVTVAAFRGPIHADPLNLDYVWRIAVGLPAIPSAILLYYRFTMPESTKFVADQKKNASLEAAERKKDAEESATLIFEPKSGEKQLADTKFPKSDLHSRVFAKWVMHPTNATRLFATAYTWFALDIAWYGLTLNQSAILSIIGFGTDKTVFDHYFQLAVGGIIIALMGTVPGYWVTVFTIEKLGRKKIQYAGFAVLSVTLLILAIFWNQIKTNGPVFVTLFTISQFFFNFGPNVTTYLHLTQFRYPL
jgi:MFS transporter, PHS family, inorganic phosphate transporter